VVKLISFDRSAGPQLFDQPPAADPEAEVRVAQHLVDLVTKLEIPIQDLAIAFSGGTATIWGTAPTQADREKAILIVGNNAGVGQVDDQLVVQEATPPLEAVFYPVQPGDTLAVIAQGYYGDAGKFMAIFEANQPMLEHPDRIYPGQMLRLPEL
jgi:nucleoid-associated protein YgaU